MGTPPERNARGLHAKKSSLQRSQLIMSQGDIGKDNTNVLPDALVLIK